MNKFIYSLLFATLILASCSKDDISTSSNKIEEIKLTTRTDEGYTLTNYEGTTLSLSLYYDINDADNETNTKWTYIDKLGWATYSAPLWKNNCNGVTLMAYAPHVDGVDDLDKLPFSVSKDQTQGVTSSDFVAYKKEGYKPDVDGSTIDISFEHKLSTLTIYLTYGDEFGDSPDVESVEMNALTSTMYSFTDDRLSAATNSASIKAYESEPNTAYSVVIPPQTIASGEEMITITIGGVDYTFENTSQYTLAAGTAYYITLRVGKDVAPVGSVAVGNWLDGGFLAGGNAEAEKKDIVLNGNVYEIASASGLRSFASLVNNGDVDINGKLMCNIDLKSEAWSPIGDSANKYGGVFDGAGYKVSGLYIDSSADCVGLFGYANSATIKNIGVEGSIVGRGALNPSIGGVVGVAVECSIIACYSSANIEGSQSSTIGGVIGSDMGCVEIVACYNVGSLTGSTNGGIVGFAMVDVTNACYFTQGNSNGFGTLLDDIVSLNGVIETMNSAITTGYRYIKVSDDVSPELESVE